LVAGWTKASNDSGVIWGGETPVLSKIVEKDSIDLAGSCFGIINPKENLCLGKSFRRATELFYLKAAASMQMV
jgi:phosphoribosylformylglycinamidine cyclo-ligase